MEYRSREISTGCSLDFIPLDITTHDTYVNGVFSVDECIQFVPQRLVDDVRFAVGGWHERDTTREIPRERYQEAKRESVVVFLPSRKSRMGVRVALMDPLPDVGFSGDIWKSSFWITWMFLKLR